MDIKLNNLNLKPEKMFIHGSEMPFQFMYLL